MKPINEWTREELLEEVLYLQQLGALTLPRKAEFPKLPGIDYFATIEPYRGCVGGDYLAIINFDDYQLKQKIRQAKKSGDSTLATALERNLDSFGIALADATGHMIAVSTVVTYLDAALRALVIGEIEQHGEVTPQMIKKLHQMLHRYMKPDYVERKPYVPFLYGEVHNDGRFRYALAGHPPPVIFSRENNRIEKLDDTHKKASTPLGVFPSRYRLDTEHFEQSQTDHDVNKIDVNELHLLMPGDVMLLHSDGLTTQNGGELSFSEVRLEGVLREVKEETARDIHNAIKGELFAFCPPDDDLTIAVIKKK